MTKERMSAASRRLLAAREALKIFAASGYVGTAMTQVADALGVSQPYLFQLYRSKKALFLDCVDLCHDTIESTIERCERERAHTGEPISLADLGRAYAALLQDEAILQFQLQAWAAACADEEIAAQCRRRMSRLVSRVQALTEASPLEVDLFFARGALRIVRTSIQMPMPTALDATVAVADDRERSATPELQFLPPGGERIDT